jgi:hypothetical protein
LYSLVAAWFVHATNLGQDATKVQSPLDARCCAREGSAMKNMLLIAVACVTLMACEKETIVQGGDKAKAKADAAAAAANVVLPPSITHSKSYRCKDNSLVYIDWLSDGSARLKASKTDVGTTVKVGEAGTPSLSGSATDASVTYNGQSCKG